MSLNAQFSGWFVFVVVFGAVILVRVASAARVVKLN